MLAEFGRVAYENGGKMNNDRTSTPQEHGSQLLRPKGWTARVVLPASVAALLTVGMVGFNSVAGQQVRATTVTPAAADLQVAVDHKPREVITVLRSADGTAVGTVTFQRKGSRTEVQAKLTLSPGLTAMDAFHGFHVHANNKPENGTDCVADPTQPPATWFTSADGHLAEPGQKHSQHTGDLPSLQVQDDGTAVIEFSSSRLEVADLLGRAVVLHASPDNFGNVPTALLPDQYTPNAPAATDKTAATGNAGDRIACGVITLKR